MKEKLVTTSITEKLQILTLVPDSLSRKYYSEYFGVLEYLIWSARELKQRKGIAGNGELFRKKVKEWPKKQLKWNEMKYILFNKTYINLQQFQVIHENKTQANL